MDRLPIDLLGVVCALAGLQTARRMCLLSASVNPDRLLDAVIAALQQVPFPRPVTLAECEETLPHLSFLAPGCPWCPVPEAWSVAASPEPAAMSSAPKAADALSLVADSDWPWWSVAARWGGLVRLAMLAAALRSLHGLRALQLWGDEADEESQQTDRSVVLCDCIGDHATSIASIPALAAEPAFLCVL